MNQQFDIPKTTWWLIKWVLIIAPVALAIGSAVAFFLWALDQVTAIRVSNPWLLYLLPVAGILIVVVYHRFGKGSEGGNNLIIDEIHDPGTGVPRRMTFFVLAGTLVTHLFGGSAGREGTAVQMGGGIAEFFARPFRLSSEEKRTLMKCGVAAGFAAVFGTPLAGVIFALEFHTKGRIHTQSLVPCLIAGYTGDFVCSAWGVGHTVYQITPLLIDAGQIFFRVDTLLALKVGLAGIIFGLVAFAFIQLSHGLTKILQERIRRYWLRPLLGGALIILLTLTLGTTAYLGLGVYPQDETGISIVSSFDSGGVTPWSWLWKIIFTAITLASGFKGGEVTPLFFIGAALGNALAVVLGVPVDLLAGIGFIAVFAGATNTPIACTIMGIELFGAEFLPYFAIGCFLSFLFSGQRSIYPAQRIAKDG